MSSQQHFAHLNHHGHQHPHGHQPHVHHHDDHQPSHDHDHDHEHDHLHDEHFEHVLAGAHHLKVSLRERSNKLEEECEDVNVQRAAHVREFPKHGDMHDVPHQLLEGHEDKTPHIESRMETARHYFRGMIGGMSLAVVLGAYFSFNTLMAHSLPLLLAVSVIFAVVIAFFLLLTVFAWVRFRGHSPLVALLPAIMFGMELSAVVCAGACDCGHRIYRRLGVFHARHRHLLQRQSEFEDHLAHRHLDLSSIKHQSKEHEEPHHAAAPHAHAHTEEVQHARHYETVYH